MATGDIKLPENMRLVQQGSHFEIVWKWSHQNLLALGIAMAVLGWIVSSQLRLSETHLAGALDGAIRSAIDDPFPFNLFGPVFSCAVIWLLYSITAQMFNHTRISVSHARIVVRHGPLPWLGNKEVEAGNIKQIFTRIHPRHRRGPAAQLFATYDVLALTRNGDTIKLLSGFGLTSEQASFIERKLEASMGIKEAPPATDRVTAENLTLVPLIPPVQRGAELRIIRRWFNNRTIFLSIFAVLWTAFSGVFAWAWLTRFGSQPLFPVSPEPVHIAMGLHLSIGLLFLYRAAAEWLNRTELTVSQNKLSVRHGPVPWEGNWELPVANLGKLTVEKSRWRLDTGASVFQQLEVHALMSDGKRRKLIGGFDTSDEACGAKQEIERYLDIQPVLSPLGSAGKSLSESGAGPEPAARQISSTTGLALVSLIGLGFIAAGLLAMWSSVADFNRQGGFAIHQLTRILGGAWPLLIGILLLGSGTKVLTEKSRVAYYLWIGIYTVPIAFFVLLAAFGTGRNNVNTAAGNGRVEGKEFPEKGSQLVHLEPGKVFRDCEDCPDMVEIEAGSFQMGSNRTQTEQPVHRVNIAKPFALGRTEITQRQWLAVMGANPSYFSRCGDDCPVERVSWEAAQEFVRKLSEKTGQAYRLPSESEWEYACRAGGTFAYCGSDNKDKVAFDEQRDGWKTHPVARKQANAFGLYDMNGSVWEWTEDCWHDNYSGAPNDGSAWATGESCSWSRVARGGSWHSGARSAAERGIAKSFWDTRGRNNQDSAIVGNTFGLRPARALP